MPTYSGSTITRQVVDLILIHRQKSLAYKAQQAFNAIGIYDTISKTESFSIVYANVIYFGNGANGLYIAAQTYFGPTPNQLNVGERTLLAGLPNAPSTNDRCVHFALARQRHAIVHEDRVSAHVISEQKLQRVFQEPIQLSK